MERQSRRRRMHVLDRLTERSYGELFVLWLLMNLAFGVIYFLLAEFAPLHGPRLPEGLTPGQTFVDSLYFSIITGTSTGYGDITPMGGSKVFVSIQCILALVLFAIFVTKLVSRRQDIALRDVHSMAFKNNVTTVRQGLFIVRKDFDRAIHEVQEGIKPAERGFENLAAAYVQAHSLIDEIPEFYGDDQALYVIDPRRQALLLEGVERTTDRMLLLLQTFDRRHIPWRADRESKAQLSSLLDRLGEVIAVWEQRAAPAMRPRFAALRNVSKRIAGLISKRPGGKKQSKRRA